MTDTRGPGRFAHGALFVALVAAMIFARLLPLGSVPRPVPGPDLILCLVIAWSIRRPDLLPVGLLVPVLLVSDLLLMRPPGLHTALLLAASEALRQRHAALQTLSIMGEIMLAGAISVAVIGGHWLVLAVLAVDQPALAVQLLQAPINAAVYPAVMLACHAVFGLRKRPTLTGRALGAMR